jgi:molecular chaperone DnaJ
VSTRERDPYEVLGVTRDADETTIKKAFRSLARELHPDVNNHDPEAEEKFKEVATAYEILSDTERRSLYDRFGHDGLRNGGYRPNAESFGSISDLFESLLGGSFGRQQNGPRQGEDIGVTVDLDLEDAYRGVERELSFEAVDRCAHCNGNGAEPGTPIETCEKCAGHGVLQGVQRTPFGEVMRQVLCDRCEGEGKTAKQPCADCHGRGRVMGRRDLKVDIPAGIAEGQRVRIAGRGHAGERGGPPGDLYVLAQIRAHETFLRDGDDLYTAVDLAPPLATLGTTATVEHFEGPVEVKVKAGTQPGEIITIKGKGMPSVRGRRHGDLRVVANVVIPRKPTKRQKQLLEELADSLEPGQLETGAETVADRLRRLLLAR